MLAPLIPQEMFLIERYSSLAYYEKMLGSWAAMVKHVETMLDRFMHHLPANYRRRRLPEQPDVVWGDLCLPNFRDTLEHLYNSRIRLINGDTRAIGAAGRVESDLRGQSEYWSGWMNEVQPDGGGKFYEHRHRVAHYADNISRTERARWLKDMLTSDYEESSRGPLDLPATWPLYRINSAIIVKTDEPILKSGIYLPDHDQCSAQLLIAGNNAPDTPIDQGSGKATLDVPTTWMLVERIADTSDVVARPFAEQAQFADRNHRRVEANHPCPQTGWWMTPAKAGSRRYFNEGEIMPSLGGDYGLTIWQWDVDQSAPKL